MSALLIRGGMLVTPHGAARGDVLIEGETIAAVGPSLPRARAARVVDADGLLVLPGLVDPHVHLREPGGEHKEDLTSGTAAALAGGFTAVLAMPNTNPPLTNRAALEHAMHLARDKALCDVGFFVGATADNAGEAAALSQAVGLKVYMEATTGDLLVNDPAALTAHFGTYPHERPLAVHAEGEMLALALDLAGRFRRRLHVCHVSTGADLALIRAARQRGVRVTCEVTPHHLFLSTADLKELGPLGEVRPPLRPPSDGAALWTGLAEIDCLATDHAPHTLAEKRSAQPPAGLPGLETALPLLLTATAEGKLTLEELVERMAEAPARIYGLSGKGCLAPGCDGDLVLVDPAARWRLGERPFHTRCGWSPYAGRAVQGRVEAVFLRGRLAYAQGRVLSTPGAGRLLQPSSGNAASVAAAPAPKTSP